MVGIGNAAAAPPAPVEEGRGDLGGGAVAGSGSGSAPALASTSSEAKAKPAGSPSAWSDADLVIPASSSAIALVDLTFFPMLPPPAARLAAPAAAGAAEDRVPLSREPSCRRVWIRRKTFWIITAAITSRAITDCPEVDRVSWRFPQSSCSALPP
eukprot:SAG22_NODE_2064_length_3060_cov_3.006754_2_plen_155_part_00